ncbi:MAG: APC family permease [Bifidobacteriaceae bacterium]|nr:APC family permease [Bifidobacteriaceae bacterium]
MLLSLSPTVVLLALVLGLDHTGAGPRALELLASWPLPGGTGFWRCLATLVFIGVGMMLALGAGYSLAKDEHLRRTFWLVVTPALAAALALVLFLGWARLGSLIAPWPQNPYFAPDPALSGLKFIALPSLGAGIKWVLVWLWLAVPSGLAWAVAELAGIKPRFAGLVAFLASTVIVAAAWISSIWTEGRLPTGFMVGAAACCAVYSFWDVMSKRKSTPTGVRLITFVLLGPFYIILAAGILAGSVGQIGSLPYAEAAGCAEGDIQFGPACIEPTKDWVRATAEQLAEDPLLEELGLRDVRQLTSEDFKEATGLTTVVFKLKNHPEATVYVASGQAPLFYPDYAPPKAWTEIYADAATDRQQLSESIAARAFYEAADSSDRAPFQAGAHVKLGGNVWFDQSTNLRVLNGTASQLRRLVLRQGETCGLKTTSCASSTMVYAHLAVRSASPAQMDAINRQAERLLAGVTAKNLSTLDQAWIARDVDAIKAAGLDPGLLTVPVSADTPPFPPFELPEGALARTDLSLGTRADNYLSINLRLSDSDSVISTACETRDWVPGVRGWCQWEQWALGEESEWYQAWYFHDFEGGSSRAQATAGIHSKSDVAPDQKIVDSILGEIRLKGLIDAGID